MVLPKIRSHQKEPGVVILCLLLDGHVSCSRSLLFHYLKKCHLRSDKHSSNSHTFQKKRQLTYQFQIFVTNSDFSNSYLSQIHRFVMCILIPEAHSFTCIQMCIHTQLYTRILTHTNTHSYTCIHTHTHTHAYTCIHTRKFSFAPTGT